MKTNLLLLLVLILCSFTNKPNRKISGMVRDEGFVPLAGVRVYTNEHSNFVYTNNKGYYEIWVPQDAKSISFAMVGYDTFKANITSSTILNVELTLSHNNLEEIVVTGYNPQAKSNWLASHSISNHRSISTNYKTEDYNSIQENIFHNTKDQSVTTFSIDVDRAAYSNTRRFLNSGQLPPVDAVRIEEMINYFDYDYPQPTGTDPISVTSELSKSPWNKGLQLLHTGLQAKTIPTDNLPPSNLVFLIDVSGSMTTPNKLPLLKEAFKLLTNQLRSIGKVSMVVYAGAAGLVLPVTSGDEKVKIREAIDQLEAGGNTAGGQGIVLAYKIAEENFIKNGNNRIILATDGDFNLGISSDDDLKRLIEEKRKGGVFLSISGFGMGNYKDGKMETLADKGNGNYAYIDNIQEARKVFISEFGGTLFTIAKDVKLQIEFNPAHVKAYRLIGYENRMMKNEEFHDDAKDAGDMGSGHTVTAIYEIVPTGIDSKYLSQTDENKYRKTDLKNIASDELLTLKMRYKKPDSNVSKLFELPVKKILKPIKSTSSNFRFAAAVVEFGLKLRKSEFAGTASYKHSMNQAKEAIGKDDEGYRSEFIQLVKVADMLDQTELSAKGE